MKMTTPATWHGTPTICIIFASMLAVIMLASAQANTGSRYSHPPDLNMGNEFRGGIRQYLACSQTHFNWGDGRHRQLDEIHETTLEAVKAGIEDVNDHPPSPNTRMRVVDRLTRFISRLGVVWTVLEISDAIEKYIDKYYVDREWRRLHDAWYEERKATIDEQVKERVRECARIQMEFNLGGGTAVWGGSNSWNLYYSDFNGTSVYSMPGFRRGIVTIHKVSN